MQPEKRCLRRKVLQHGNDVSQSCLVKSTKWFQRFLLAVRKKGRVVNAIVARSVATALVKRSGKKELEVIDLGSRWWIQSLFRRMHFVRRTATTSKVENPEGAKKEAYFFA